MRFLPLIFLSFTARAADMAAYPAQTVSAKGVSTLRVSGVSGELRLKGSKAKHFRIKVSHSKGKKFEDWSLSVDRQGDALVLEVFNVAVGPQWRNLVREELWPKFDIEIEGPSVPAVISWREGDVRVQGWQNKIEASYLRAHFFAAKTRGDLALNAAAGAVTVSDHKGPLVIKGERGKIDLTAIVGPLEISWLDGVVRAGDLSGPTEMDVAQGEVRLTGVRGRLKATGGGSRWMIRGHAPGDFEVVTESGAVNVAWTGGAKLFLTTNTGEIAVPKKFAVERRESARVVEAIDGPTPRGQVFVRTKSGAISWQ